jgi:hypothetical protein
MPSSKQAALKVSTGLASPVRPWAERRGRPATMSGVQNCRIVASDRSVTRHSNLRAGST